MSTSFNENLKYDGHTDMTKLVVAFAVLRVCLKTVRHVNLFSDRLSKAFSCCGSQQLVLRLQSRRPVTGPVWPRGFQEFRFPDFHDIRHMKVVRSSASRTGRL